MEKTTVFVVAILAFALIAVVSIIGRTATEQARNNQEQRTARYTACVEAEGSDCLTVMEGARR